MAWRRHPASPGVPEKLARFVASEWPDAKCWHEAVREWSRACLDWLAADPGRALPFGQNGDAIDALNEAGRYSRAVPPCPHEYRPAVHWTNGPPGDGETPS